MLVAAAKRLISIIAFLVLLAGVGTPRLAAAATSSQIEALSHRLVNQVLSAKPGDVVLVTSGPQNLELLEDLSADLRQVGAWPIISISTDRMNVLYFQRTPAKFDAQEQAGPMGLARMIAAQINIDYETDPSAFNQVPAKRFSDLSNAGAPVSKYMMAHGVPFIEVGNGLYPSKFTAQQYNVSVAQLADIFWSGVTADPANIRAHGAAIRDALRSGSTVHVTAPDGTDVTFKASPSSVLINDGTVSAAARARGGAAINVALPAGDVTFIPTPGSANGKVVFGTFYLFTTRIDKLTFKVANGKIVSSSAASGYNTFAKYYNTGGAQNEFSFADIGANTGIHLPAGGLLSAASMAGGMVTLGMGNNYSAGGTNTSAFSFATWVPNATVTIHDTTMVKNGSLTH
jgi:aminopeptidase